MIPCDLLSLGEGSDGSNSWEGPAVQGTHRIKHGRCLDLLCLESTAVKQDGEENQRMTQKQALCLSTWSSCFTQSSLFCLAARTIQKSNKLNQRNLEKGAQSLFCLGTRHCIFMRHEIAIVDLFLVSNLLFLLNKEGHLCTVHKVIITCVSLHFLGEKHR